MISTYYPPYHIGGDAVFVRYLANELVHRGHEVHIAYSPDAYHLARGMRETRISSVGHDAVVKHPEYSRLGRIAPIAALTCGSIVDGSQRTDRVIGDIHPDVVHYHNTMGFVCRPIKTPYAVTLHTAHDFYSICPKGDFMRRSEECAYPHQCQLCLLRSCRPPQLWRIGESRRNTLKDDVIVLAPSEYLADRLTENGITVSRVLRNFVPDPGSAASECGRERRSLVYLGLLEKFKGVDTLYQAFMEEKDRNDFEMILIGEGSLKRGIRKKVQRDNMQDRVRVLGFLDRSQWIPVVRSASYLVVPSECRENSPLNILEAFSLGVPVIASDSGGIPEIATPDSGSVLFESGRIRCLAEAIQSAWTAEQELLDRRYMARSAYEKWYNPESHIRNYLKTISLN